MNANYLYEASTMTNHLGVRPYSGRGMYGEKCLGVVINANLVKFGIELANRYAMIVPASCGDWIYVAMQEIKSLDVRTDSMGRDTIVYFPSIPWKDYWKEVDDEGNDVED